MAHMCPTCSMANACSLVRRRTRSQKLCTDRATSPPRNVVRSFLNSCPLIASRIYSDGLKVRLQLRLFRDVEPQQLLIIIIRNGLRSFIRKRKKEKRPSDDDACELLSKLSTERTKSKNNPTRPLQFFFSSPLKFCRRRASRVTAVV